MKARGYEFRREPTPSGKAPPWFAFRETLNSSTASRRVGETSSSRFAPRGAEWNVPSSLRSPVWAGFCLFSFIYMVAMAIRWL